MIITIEGLHITITDESSSILDNLEHAGVFPSYQCREGFCGVCRCRLIAGKIAYDVTPLACANDQDIFICVARAQTNLELLFG